ncbi:MAG TPA: putative quinol monooxygenase [Thermoanaerobaculia bacterium]|nr:putative quinol monooxygenase [Thermoanaerobaculia bacterium]
MPASPLCVLATFRARNGKAYELKGVLLTLIEPTRKEPGCLRYDLWQNESDEHEMTFVEEWESEQVLADHLQTAHIAEARLRYTPLLAGDLDLRKFHIID